MKKGDNYKVYDAIHKTMQFKDESVSDTQFVSVVKTIINSPHFQRLKGIKQLGFSDMVFPTAVHTRFSHSLGAAYICWRIFDNFENDEIHNDSVKREAFRYKQLLAVLAALVHDIGHGPFSHTFEEFLKDYIGIDVNHEDWASFFLEDIKKHSSAQNRLLSDLIEEIETLISPDRAKKQGRRVKDEYRICADVVSSQLDCDRLDYLLRDSHFCGVEYGSYDLQWLLHCMQQKEIKGADRLVINSKGLGTVEHVLMARRLMTQNIYYHKTVKGFEHLFKYFLKRLANQIQVDVQSIVSCVSPRLIEFLKVSNDCISKKMDKCEFMNRAFSSYASLCDYDFWYTIRGLATCNDDCDHSLREICERFYYRKPPLMVPVRKSCYVKAKSEEHKVGLKDEDKWKFRLMTLVFSTYKTKDEERKILIENEEGDPQYIGDLSEIVWRLRDSNEPKHYLLFDRDFFLSNKDKWMELLERVECPEGLLRKLEGLKS